MTQLRTAEGLSQTDLAFLTGVSRSSIQRLERRLVTDPSLRTLNNLALALGVQLEDLIEPEWREWQVFAASPPEPPSANLRQVMVRGNDTRPGPKIRPPA